MLNLNGIGLQLIQGTKIIVQKLKIKQGRSQKKIMTEAMSTVKIMTEAMSMVKFSSWVFRMLNEKTD